MLSQEDINQIRRIIQEEMNIIIDKQVFSKNIQILDARNFQFGRGTGTKLGTATDQKLSVYGETPVVQAGAIESPTADVDSLKTAVDAIRTALTNFGITA